MLQLCNTLYRMKYFGDQCKELSISCSVVKLLKAKMISERRRQEGRERGRAWSGSGVAGWLIDWEGPENRTVGRYPGCTPDDRLWGTIPTIEQVVLTCRARLLRIITQCKLVDTWALHCGGKGQLQIWTWTFYVAWMSHLQLMLVLW